MTRALLEQALDALSRPRPQNSFYQRACDDADVAKAIRAYLHEQPLQLVKHLTAMQALEALEELVSSARGDEPFNHAAAPVVRAFIESAMLSASLPKVQPEYKLYTESETCKWQLDDDDSSTWSSGCGELWTYIDGGPTENRVKYCHGCGKPLVLGVPAP